MTDRGRAVLALGLLAYVVAWIFGSRPLYPVAVGLVLAVALAAAWVGLSVRAPHVRRQGATRDAVEGDDITVELEVETTGALAPPTLVAHETPGPLGDVRVELRRAGRRRFRGGYALHAVRRGRYAFGALRLTVEDPFALVRREIVQGEPQALVVFPRLVRIDRLFTEGGAHAQDGRRLLLRRPTGFDLHSVREHAHGESLRMVHWPTTARRGTLMVRELEDAPRDEIAVLLDGDARAITRDLFDVAVRAAGSVLDAHVRRGRRCALVVNSAARETQAIASDIDWSRALEVLAGANADGRSPAFALLDASGNAAARALEVVVVTARVDAALADRLVQRALSRRGVSVVYVDGTGEPEPQLLRLQAAAIPVAVVRPGSDLAAALSAQESRVA